MLQMFVLALSLYNTWNRGVFLLCKITNLLIYRLYNIILAIYFKKDLSIILFILDLVLYILLDIGFIMIKLKKDKKGIIKNLQLGICSVFVVLALGMVYFNLNEIYSSVMILSGMMMVLSTPFEEARSLWKEH